MYWIVYDFSHLEVLERLNTYKYDKSIKYSIGVMVKNYICEQIKTIK